jgi:hypothetical protein
MAVEQVTSASNTGQDSISSMVQVKLRKQSIIANLLMDVTQFAQPGDKSISFPRWANEFVVQKLSGGQKGDDQEAVFDLDKLELTEEAHIQWVIKKFDQARAKVQILQQAIGEATTQHSLGLDVDLYNALKASIHASNILTPGALTQDNVVDMITKANENNIPASMRAWLFSASSYGTLLKIDGFVDASKSNLDIVKTGQIGTLYGYPVFQSNVVASGERYLVHQAAVAFGFGAAPAVEDQKAIEYGTGSRRWVMDQLYGVEALNEGKLAVKQANA